MATQVERRRMGRRVLTRAARGSSKVAICEYFVKGELEGKRKDEIEIIEEEPSSASGCVLVQRDLIASNLSRGPRIFSKFAVHGVHTTSSCCHICLGAFTTLTPNAGHSLTLLVFLLFNGHVTNVYPTNCSMALYFLHTGRVAHDRHPSLQKGMFLRRLTRQ